MPNQGFYKMTVQQVQAVRPQQSMIQPAQAQLIGYSIAIAVAVAAAAWAFSQVKGVFKGEKIEKPF